MMLRSCDVQQEREGSSRMRFVYVTDDYDRAVGFYGDELRLNRVTSKIHRIVPTVSQRTCSKKSGEGFTRGYPVGPARRVSARAIKPSELTVATG